MSNHPTTAERGRAYPWLRPYNRRSANQSFLYDQLGDTYSWDVEHKSHKHGVLAIVVIKLGQSIGAGEARRSPENISIILEHNRTRMPGQAAPLRFAQLAITDWLRLGPATKARSGWIEKSMVPNAFLSLSHSGRRAIDAVNLLRLSETLRLPAPEKQYQEEQDFPDWFTTIHGGRDNVVPSAVLMQIFSGLRTLYNADGPLAVDDLLRLTDLDKMHAEAMVSLLRYSFPMRSKLPTWKAYLTKVGEELRARGINVERALRGLNAA